VSTARRIDARTLGIVRVGAVAVVIGLALLEFAPVWRDGYIAERNSRGDIPTYWNQAAAAIDRGGSSTRVLELPGSPSAAYRWGTTGDPITPGLVDRPWVSRELIPYFGSAAAANLVIALDHRMQEGTFEPRSLAPIARLLNSGTVLLRSDLEYERSDTPRPRTLWAELTDPRPSGLGPPDDFGDRVPNVATRFPVVDEQELATPPASSWPPPVALFPVAGALPIVSAAPAKRPVLVAGDGEALVDAAAAGLLQGSELVLYAASFARDPAALRQVLGQGADLVVSDTNRRRARRWGAIRDVTGFTEHAGEVPLRDDPEDKRLDVFPGSDDRDRSVVEQRGVRRATATGYGERSIYAPDQRAAAAFDGDPQTAWRVGGEDDPTGQRLVVDLKTPVTTNHVTLKQPLIDEMDETRFITRARLHFGSGEPVTVDLDQRSRSPEGQTVKFPERKIRHLAVEVLDTNLGQLASYGGVNGVGFSEVQIGSVADAPRVDEVVRLPTRLVRSPGARSLDHRLVYLMSRLGYDPASRRRADEEPSLSRRFEVPSARAFSVTGTARVAPNASDGTLDEVIGTTAPGARFGASGHLRGDAGARASRAFDHDARTAWVAPMGAQVEQVGQWVGVELDEPVTLDHLGLELVTDGRHSVPTRMHLEVDGAAGPSFDLPALADKPAEGATTAVPLAFPAVAGRRLRLVVDAVRPVTTPDPRTHRALTLPVAIAETGMPDVPVPGAPPLVPSECRNDLLSLDGAPVGVAVSGDDTAAGAHGALSLRACDGRPLELGAGSHVLRSAKGLQTGLDVDRVVLGSDRGGGPLGRGALGARRSTAGARVRVTGTGPTSVDARVRTDGKPFWLVLGQSQSSGWQLEVDGAAHVGPQRLVNGYANGWQITPERAGQLTVRLRWTPQDLVWWGIGISAVAVALCIVLALRRTRGAAAVAGVPAEALDAAPSLASPFVSRGTPPGRGSVAAVTVLMALAAGVASRPWVGLVVGVATLVALLRPRARALLSLGCVAALVIAAAYVVVQQLRHGYPTIASWPSQFDAVADLAWLAVWLLAADVVVQRVRDR
jgi:arabinofuranan 3-O-arabinosyltransferase